MSGHKGPGISFNPESIDDLLGIDSYGDGGFRLRGRRFEGGVIVTPNGVYPLEAANREELLPEVLDELVRQKAEIEIVMIGVGDQMLPLPKETRLWLQSGGWSYDLMDTGAAARTYNLLLIEGRRVAAVMLPVD